MCFPHISKVAGSEVSMKKLLLLFPAADVSMEINFSAFLEYRFVYTLHSASPKTNPSKVLSVPSASFGDFATCLYSEIEGL